MNKVRIATVVVVFAVVLVWLLSGILTQPDPEPVVSLAEAKEQRGDSLRDAQLQLVRVRRSTASEQNKSVVLRGKTIDRDSATVAARTSGQVIARQVEIGDNVAAGDVLCELEVLDRETRVEAARDSLELAAEEFDSVVELTEQGFERELEIARAKATLAGAEQRLQASEIELQNTKIHAPIAGVVDEVFVNVGDFMGIGQPCVTILNLDPIYAQGYVTEDRVGQLSIGGRASVRLPTGEVKEGELSFISKRADSRTRTFRVEITLQNTDYDIRSGLSSSIELVVDTKYAHKVPTSVMLLDEFGALGVKTVDDDDKVEVHAVEIVREDKDGVWVAGLPTNTSIITVGQGLVIEGEQVAVDYE